MRLALSQLEASYLEQARRGPELTRHFSLKDIPIPGHWSSCAKPAPATSRLTRALFDLEQSRTLFRRIHSVAISIAGVTGPYTPVNATLRAELERGPPFKVETTPTSTSIPHRRRGRALQNDQPCRSSR
ncbi:hypothetical protein F2981_32700 (plasmid) [Sinorhizobium meliloti]|nr:hypothetical protein [Sinorhizobium meliloti]